MEYRTDFFLGLVVSLGFSSLAPLFQYLIFTKTRGYPGWNFQELILFQGVLLLWFGLKDTLFGKTRNFMDDLVRKGEFDRLLLKPYPPIGILLVSGFNYFGLGSIIAGIIVIIFALGKQNLPVRPEQLILFVILMICGIIFYMAVTVFYCTLVLMVIFTGRISEILDKFLRFSEFPVEIFPQLVQLILIIIIPFAVWVYFPAQALLNRLNWMAFAGAGICITMFLLSLIFWQSQMKKYTSAGG